MPAISPDSIQRPGVAQDPGARARPSAVQLTPEVDLTAKSLTGFADTLSGVATVFNRLRLERQKVEDQSFIDHYQLELNKRFSKIENDLSNSPEAARPDFVGVLDKRLSESQKETFDEVTSDGRFSPSEEGKVKAAHAAMALRAISARRSVVGVHNQRVATLFEGANTNIQEIARMAGGDGDLNAGLDRVNASVEPMRGVLAPDKFEDLRQKSRALVIGNVIQGHIDRGELPQAKDIVNKYTGFAGKNADETKKSIIAAAGREGIDPLVVLAIAEKESNFNSSAKNKDSNASGLFQFIPETGKTFGLPENAANATVEQQSEAGAKFTAFNAAALRRALNRDPTPGEIYLAHFLGDKRALQVLRSEPNAKLSDILPAEYLDKNKFMKGWDVNRLTTWAQQDMSSRMKKLVSSGMMEGRDINDTDSLSISTAVQLNGRIDNEIEKQKRVASVDKAEAYERSIIDMSAGLSKPFSRYEIESDQAIGESHRNALLRQYDHAIASYRKADEAWKKFQDPNGGAFNPYDKSDKDSVDAVFMKLGSDEKALKAVVDRTGMLPTQIAKKIRGDLHSSDPARVQGALTLAANLISSRPTLFDAADGGIEIEKAASEFRHRVDNTGATAEEAVKHFILSQTPEYKARVSAKIKSEDLNEVVKKNIAVGDIGSAFDESPLGLAFNPNTGFNPEQRSVMFKDYESLFREEYAKSGDVNNAKSEALRQLKKVWGVSRINGTATVMRYSPEAAPIMFDIENASELIGNQLVSDVKAESGKDVKSSNIRLDPIPGKTAAAYKSGQSVPYNVSWVDENGAFQTFRQGRYFILDRKDYKEKQTQKREADFREQQIEAGKYEGDPFVSMQ